MSLVLSAGSFAFAPLPLGVTRKTLSSLQAASGSSLPGAEVDELGNNIAIKNLLLRMEESRLLSKVAEAGLLSKAHAAGISLSKLEPLLLLASENPDVLVLVEASGPELLPILPTVVELAPPLLPLLAAAIAIPPAALQSLAAASFLAAVGTVVVVPDDTIVQVAVQTFAVGVLGVAVPAASLVGAFVLGQITK